LKLTQMPRALFLLTRALCDHEIIFVILKADFSDAILYVYL